MFASAGNLAARARVTREQAVEAVASFEGPDPDSGDPDNDGRRIERFPGGWHVLNAHKYRALVTKAIIQAQTRERVAKHRAKAAGITLGNVSVTLGNATITQEQRTGNASVTPSVAVSTSTPKAKAKTARERAAPAVLVSMQDLIAEGVDQQHATDWLTARKAKRLPLTPTAWDDTKAEACKAGLTVAGAIKRAAKNGWAGFKASWPDPAAERPSNGGPAPLATVTVPMGPNPADEFHEKMRLADLNKTLPPAGLRERFKL